MALNITYILGAGASHGALPTVKEMDAAIAAQLTWLKGLKAHGKIVLDDAYSSDLNAFAARAKEYGTFDTYARSLFLLEEKEELKLLKVHLSFFFAFELFHDSPTYDHKGLVYSKNRGIDVGYYGWLATILQGGTKLPTNVRVLSWNYDIQMEYALSKHLRLERVPDLYQSDVLGIRNDLDPMGRKSTDIPFLLHLNGVAGIYESSPGRPQYLFKDVNSGISSEENLRRIADLYSYVGSQRKEFLNCFVNTFSFAWEDHTYTNATRIHANTIMNQTDILVVVGYSFPSFNRKWDLALLRQFIANGRQEKTKRIVVQSRSTSAETFKHLVRLEEDRIPVMVESDISQFYLPPEFFDESLSGELTPSAVLS